MKVPVPVHICSIVLVLPLLLAVLQTATAQKNGIHIYSLTVDSKVSSRFAHTVITSRVVNRAEEAQEAIFEMELPKKAFITNFSMIIDGVTYPGNVKEKAAAQEQYSAAVARGQSAGLVKVTGRKTEQFQVSVNVAPAAKITFELVYEELLKRHLGVYELLLKVRPQQLVKHLQMDIHIFEPQGISFLETESTFMTEELADALTISKNKTKAHIQFKPTLAQQQKSPGQQDTVLDGNFIVRYDVNRTVSGGSIQIENGYFVHYFAPEGLSTIPKNVVFVIDKSGSMNGRKIHQTREAIIKILSDLNPEDQFNLITFSSEVHQWKPLLVPASTENVNEAKSYAAGIWAMGGTNINEAMLTAVKLLESNTQAELLPEGSISLIILLTDGDPTVGETNPNMILKNVKEAIDGRCSLFCLGFGFDVSYAFLEKMALDNGGLARRIYEDSDSTLQLQDFYQEVASPLLTTVAFQYPSNAVEEVTQDNFRLLFKGSEMVVAGKLRDRSPDVLSAIVKGKMHKQNITFQTKSSVAKQEEEFRSPKYIFHNFMERLWAYLTIQQQLEQMVSASDAEKQALKTRALNLSLEYNFVTPLTSMVVTKPEGQDQSQVAEKPGEDDNRHKNVHAGGYDLFRTHRPNLKGARSGYSRRGGLSNQGFVHGGFPQMYSIGFAGSLDGLRPLRPPVDASHFPSSPWRHSGHVLPGQPGQPGLPGQASAPGGDLLRVMEILSKGPAATTAPPSAPNQVPPVLLTLPGPSMDRLCVDIEHSQGPMNLLADPDQGIEVTGQYDTQMAGFHWIEVTFKNPQVQIRASPEHVTMTQNQRNYAFKWKETLFSVLPGLKMIMKRTGLLQLGSPDKVTISLMPLDGPGKGLLLFLPGTDHFSSHANGTLGQFYQDVSWETPEVADDSKRILKVQGKDYSATREFRLDYQEGPPGKTISCWSVKL